MKLNLNQTPTSLGTEFFPFQALTMDDSHIRDADPPVGANCVVEAKEEDANDGPQHLPPSKKKKHACPHCPYASDRSNTLKVRKSAK